MKRTRSWLNDLKTLRWQNFLVLFVAGCINAFGVTVFLAPVKLYDSGISGTTKIARMRTIIHTIDPKAFVTISEVADMFKSND